LRAIVHIGTEKTGTTSIQKFLFQNRKKLRTAGFHFLQSAGSTNNRALPAYFVAEDRFDDFYRDEGISTREAKAEFRKQFLQNFEHELATLPKNIHTVVISSEHFHSRLRSREELDRVKEFFTAYFDKIKIICYLRDQVSTCSSYYSTGLKSGNSATFAEFFQRCNPENYYFNYYEVLSNWERCFGIESLDVSLFSRKSFLNNKLLDDFTAKLDPALIGVLSSDVDIENESLTPFGQALARGINLAFPVRTSRAELAQVREKCKSTIYQAYRGTGRQPSLAMQQKIYSDFTESNELLRTKYFPQLSQVFDPPVEEPAPIPAIDEAFVEALSSLLNEIRKHGKDIIRPDEYAAIIRNMLIGVFDVLDEAEQPGEKGLAKAKAKKPANADESTNVTAVITKANLRLMLFAANDAGYRNPKTGWELMKLVQQLDPSSHNIVEKMDALKRKDELMQKRKFAITYTGVAESFDPQERRKQAEEFGAWLNSFADCMDGPVINSLKDTHYIRLENAELISKPSISAGFVVIRVDSEEAANLIASRCPHLLHGGTVFVSEVLHITPKA
jgi:hypothetical protein